MNAKTILLEVPHPVLPRTRAVNAPETTCLGKTSSRREVAFRWKAVLFVLLVVAVLCVHGKVIVKSVSPTRGSLAGGTRVHIQGSGFSTNTGGSGNIIKFGKYFCDPIPLHCTTNQIACKTRPALLGALEWTGWTNLMQVTVVVDGEESECIGRPDQCGFSYHYGWYHTPRVDGLLPAAVEEGTIITVRGRFHANPFAFEVLRAPNAEIPLASVKVANRAGEQQKPENEPFGQSGTRCALFDQTIEEPFGVNEVNGEEVNWFKCQVNGPRDAGRYNLSVALLGDGTKDWQMRMGEAQVLNNLYTVDHQGVSFMLHHVAKVSRVSPSTSGVMGGNRITITGSGFSIDKSVVKVIVAGSPCLVDLATRSRIECVLPPRDSTIAYKRTNFSQGSLQPGTRGVRRSIWYNRGTVSIDDVRLASVHYSPQWMRCASEGSTCNCPFGTVRYGASGCNFALNRFRPTRFVNSTIVCGSSLFGGDPAPGYAKTCDCHPGTPNTPFFSQPDVQQVEKNIFESDINIRSARGDACGPHMQYTGFFRAPVAGNYSFLLSSDDGARLWVSKAPASTTSSSAFAVQSLELLIQWNRYSTSRSFDREQAWRGRHYNPSDKIALAKEQRATRQVELREGEYLYVDAHYSSGGGGDNFALAVVQHNTTVNRKDVPAAIDEKQLIDISQPHPNYEVQKVTLKGTNLGGTFRLSLGGKLSRPLSPDSTAEQVGAAVRQMLSNCEGDIGLPTDSAGNTFECFSERGYTYRGLARTTTDGDECIPWIDTPYYDPWLVVVAGLDGNLCRNPDFRMDGPWCMNSRKEIRSCKLARCGGNVSQVSNAPALASFEDEEPSTESLPFSNTAEERDGVTPKVVRGNAYCGRGALYMHNAYGMMKNEWRFDNGKGRAYPQAAPGLYPFGTKQFPFMCMAYRIPASTKVGMLILIERRNSDGSVRINDHVWKSVYMSNTEHNSPFRKIGSWNVIADDTWRYACIDLQYMLDTAAAAATEPDETLFLGQNHLVKDIIFWTMDKGEMVPLATYANNEFWIDEFSISKTPRSVSQTGYPQIPTRNSDSALRLVDVKNVTAGEERSWLIALTSDDCSTPAADFTLNAAMLTGLIRQTEVTKLQEHSPQITGSVLVNVRDKEVSFSPYSEASQVKAAFEASGAIGKSVNVMRTGTCQTGFGWLVTMTHLSGDVPLMTVRISEEQTDSKAEARVYPYIDGGHLMGPISMDYMHEPVIENNVQVIINNGAANCETNALNVSLCLFSYDDALTPMVTQLQSTKTSTGTYSVTITGTGFTGASGSPPLVTVATLYFCNVSFVSDTSVRCQISFPFLAAGMYPVEVIITGKGAARGNVSLNYELEIGSITPSNLNRKTVNTVTIRGAGFSPTLRSNTLRIGGTSCEPIKVSERQLECTLGPAQIDNRRQSTLDVQIILTPDTPGGTPVSKSKANLVTVLDVNQPTVSSVTPTAGSVGGGYSVTIFGSAFSQSVTDISVLLGSSPCAVTQASAVQITCSAGAGVVGTGVIMVVVTDVGVSATANSPQFEYQLSVASLTPNSTVFGFGGGTTITVSGQGFLSGASGNKSVTPLLQLAGSQTFVIGVFIPTYIPEIHQLVITANYVNEVQQVLVPASNYFVLSLWNRTTERLKTGITAVELQAALNKLISASSTSVSISTTAESWQVKFPSSLGDVTLLSGLTCADLNGTCSDSGINVTELVAGAAPYGIVGLSRGNISRVGWTEKLNVSIGTDWKRVLSDYFGSVRVTRRRPNNQQVVWEITYLDLTGKCEVPDVDDSAVIGGRVEMKRVQNGVTMPDGSFAMKLGGRISKQLPLNATSAQVQEAVTEAFPDVLSASVYSVDQQPGQFLDRSYPRQWVVKLERHGVVGASVERCTSPLFVDWDPSACPNTAPNMFLHYYPWYWPPLLPKPSDLGQETIRSQVQAACDAEARTLQLRPVQCQARVPLESLPVCGEGSGVHPPCWIERFTTAKVRHGDGSDVVYARDDSKVSSDYEKGYRFWTRTDIQDLRQAQVLSVNHSVVAVASGVHVMTAYVKAQQFVTSAASQVTNTSLTTTISSLMMYGRSVAEMVQSDYLLKPVLHISFSPEDPLLRVSGVTFQSGLTMNGNITRFDAPVSFPYSSKANSAAFTAEAWVKVDVNDSATGTAALIQNVGADGLSGYALVLMSTGNWRFYLAVAGYEETQEGSMETPVPGFSVLTAPAAAPGTWSHVALTFDGDIQRIYVDGQLAHSSYLSGAFRPNFDGNMVFSGPCGAWLRESSCDGSVQFSLDEVLFYDLALPASALSAHASLINQTMHVQFKVKSQNVLSPCTEAFCALQFKTSSTASVFALQPARGYDGLNITIYGKSFSTAPVQAVRLANGNCDSVIVISDTQLTCTARGAGRLGAGQVDVVLQDLGASFSAGSFEWISQINSISPTEGSLLGGTRITMSVFGWAGNVNSVSVLIGSKPCIVQSFALGSIECLLVPLPRPSSTAPRVLPVVLFVDGKPSDCGVTGGCSMNLSLAATPALTSVSVLSALTDTVDNSTIVKEGDILIITGPELPTASGVSVRVGQVTCNVETRNSTHLLCRLQQGAGGYHRLQVLFDSGYATDFESRCCERVAYAVSVSSVSMSAGSIWGGQTVTITGSGFAPQQDSTTPSSTRVFIGGRRARVRSATYNSVVVDAPAIGEKPVIGLEHEHVWKKIRHCGLPGTNGAACTGQQLRSCAYTMLFASNSPILPSSTPNNRIIAIPGSDGTSLDASLVDGDAATVWMSKPGSDTITLMIDLGSSQTVKHILIYWAGRSMASQIKVSAGPFDPANCSSWGSFVEPLMQWTNIASSGPSLSKAWIQYRDPISTIANLSFSFLPRVFMIEMRGLQAGLPSFGIRDIVFVRDEVIPAGLPPENLARSCGQGRNQACTTAQSSTNYGGLASRAVDNNLNTQWGGSSVTHTDAQANPWWMVDFERQVKVVGLRVYNRGDCCQNQLQGFSVYVGNNQDRDKTLRKGSNAACAINQDAPMVSPYYRDITCVTPLTGQYLYIQVPTFGNQHLMLGEVQVYGEDDSIRNSYALPFPSLQPVWVEVGGLEAACDNASEHATNVCSFNYSSAPEVLSVSPVKGTAGTLITINAKGLNLADCASNKITISNGDCAVQSCGGQQGGDGWLNCSVSRISGGTFIVDLMVGGVPALSSQVFTYLVTITAITPADGGLGGSYTITVTGDGFHTDPNRITATLCDYPCKVTVADFSGFECLTQALSDNAATPGQSSLDIAIADGRDDATEDFITGAIVLSNGVLSGYVLPNSFEWALRVVYLRFSLVDIPQGMGVETARLQVRTADASCRQGSLFRIWAEATDYSKPFDASLRGSLGARSRTQTYHDWITTTSWRWMAEAQESSDFSQVINDVLARPGWRAGNALTLVLQQRKDKSASCNMMSTDFSLNYAPKLLLKVANFSVTTPIPNIRNCSLSVTVNSESNKLPTRLCEMTRVRVTANASSSNVPVLPSQQADIGNGNEDLNLYRRVLDKNSIFRRVLRYTSTDLRNAELNYVDSILACASIGSRLCRKDKELLVGGRLFFGDQTPKAGFPAMVPFEVLWDGARPNAAHSNNWLQASQPYDEQWYPGWDWNGDAALRAENFNRTKLIPCCGVTGNPAYMAVDETKETFWDSGATEMVNLTLTVATSDFQALQTLEIMWTEDYAREYRILISRDGQSWFELAEQQFGDGGLDSLDLVQSCSKPREGDTVWAGAPCNITVAPSQNEQLVLRIEMRRRAAGRDRYGIQDIDVLGCRAPIQTTTITARLNSANGTSMFTARMSLTPNISSIVPQQGTTAGGSDVTIIGRFFSSVSSDVAVSFGPFACPVKSITSLSQDEQKIVCVSSASGILNGGRKFVMVSIKERGTTVTSEAATFWYIDTWSARTTWGGKAPPTGCGSWVYDKDCTDTVYIPEGQVVLLDQSLPRFYLILIEGTLIFDRKDITLSANYILLRGGTLQIGTKEEPFTQNVLLRLYGHPKSMELPTFGSKVIACYECKMDIHGTPQVAWTQLAATALPGDTEITLQEEVNWPVGSKIVIATTDFESVKSSHSEVATVAAVLDNGKRIRLNDVRVCHEYTPSGIPMTCSQSDALIFPHLGEAKTFDGRSVSFRAEVGLLSRNIVIEGDHDETLCPMPDIADDGVTFLSCNQFGAQIFFHSPGHESLIARLSNFEIRNGGQAFRLGRYAIHWHMVGNMRESFQRNVSVHHSWNRGAAIHGINYLRLESNFAYHVMGHTFFIEDGVEEYNRVENNLAIKTISSMSLLNTDQTPACFWIVSGKNFILNNHAVASKRYGIWFRPEISATGTSVNTPLEVHPINIPTLDFRGNEAHSNGKYGLRIFDIYKPNSPSVIRDMFVWRNGQVGWTATVIGQIGFDGFIAVQNGLHVFESRSVDVTSWDVSYIRNSLFVDYTGLPLARSVVEVTISASSEDVEMGGPMEGGLLLPWNVNPGGGMQISNVTFVNFKNACVRGCAHCGRGGSPLLGDGGFETRFEGVRFVNSSQRALFRHPNEGFFYDLDGSFTGSGVRENRLSGGSVTGSSFVGTSVLLPPDKCTPSVWSTQGTGGSICTGLTFRRANYWIQDPSIWIGKSLCVRMPWSGTMNTCEDLRPECNCLPWQKKGWNGNVWLMADGYRYNLQHKLMTHELADPKTWRFWLQDAYQNEIFMLTHRLLQWQVADRYGRPLYWTSMDGGYDQWPSNYFLNASACDPLVGYCGKVGKIANWGSTQAGALQYDSKGTYQMGLGMGGEVPIFKRSPPVVNESIECWAACGAQGPCSWCGIGMCCRKGWVGNGCDGTLGKDGMGHVCADVTRKYTIKEDSDGSGALHTMLIKKPSETILTVNKCPKAGCWPPPPPPEVVADKETYLWSETRTWLNTTDSLSNPLNKFVFDVTQSTPGNNKYKLAEKQQWAAGTPSNFEDVWIPKSRRVVLDVSTPILGRLIIEGILIINTSSSVNLTATWIEIKGGSLIIAACDQVGNIIGPFEGRTTITLLGTNQKLAGIHGNDPRETPELILGREALQMGPAVLGVMGTFIAKGKPVSNTYLPLGMTADRGAISAEVVGQVGWVPGNEVVITPSDYDAHEAEVRTISNVTRTSTGSTIIHFTVPLMHKHYSGRSEMVSRHNIRIQSQVGLLTRNIVIKGEGQGEETSYHFWNHEEGDEATKLCGNGLCEPTETSITCSSDCVGPAYEFGASILVGTYSEDYTMCDISGNCEEGFRRKFSGRMEIDNIELRYFGQNNLRAGIELTNLGDAGANVSVANVAFNRGYFGALDIRNSNGVKIYGNVIFRSHLPTLRIQSGQGNVISSNLAIVGIFWNTHRGAHQGKGVEEWKLAPMIGMFHDRGQSSKFLNNIAAGSERAAFSGSGFECGDNTSFVGNVAHSSLAGYWFDPKYTLQYRSGCAQLSDFTAWKIWEYGIYGEIDMPFMNIIGAKLVDCRAGIFMQIFGANAIAHVIRESKVKIGDSLIVGHSANGDCGSSRPTLHTCDFFAAWCWHLPPANVGIYLSSLQSSPGMAAKISPWDDADAYPALYGFTQVENVTFVNFSVPCTSGPKARHRHFAISAFAHSDSLAPLRTKSINLVNVDPESIVSLPDPDPGWINPTDNIDMDGDGPKQALIIDEDGSLVNGTGGAILPRAEKFSKGSFFGLPFKDTENKAYMERNFTPSWAAGSDQAVGWDKNGWYPNVPQVMWSSKNGQLLQMAKTWLSRGFGIARDGCTYMEAWNGWKCPERFYHRLVIESMDADHEIRRLSPVAISSEGYTNLLNGCQDHGWCFSYTCLKRLMTFWTVVKRGTENYVHFSGKNPQGLRLHLSDTKREQDKILVKIYYQESLRLQVFVGSTFVEDLNRFDGKSKEQLVRDGRMSANSGTGYTDQFVSLLDACNIGGTSQPISMCMTPSNVHGANRFNRAENMLEIVVAGHDLDGCIEIKSMPVVAVSMGISVSVTDFYKIKDSFLSNLAFTLGIDVKRITIVDVVAGNARRRRNLLSASTQVNFEVEPSPVIELSGTSFTVLENVETVSLQVTRSVNIIGRCGVFYSVANRSTDTALPGVHFVAKTGFILFESREETKQITVEILSEPGFRAQEVSLSVIMSDVDNATLGSKQVAVINVRNIHMPAPLAPVRASGTSDTTLMVSWSPASWLTAPSPEYNQTMAWDLQCRHPDAVPTDFQSLPVPFATSSSTMFGGLSAYRRVQCRLRVQSTEGSWSSWSVVSSDMYTLPVCADGSRHGQEECDDGNTMSGDGCSEACVVESGYACSASASGGIDRCRNGCNNGTREDGEACDDGNIANNDGCDNKCRVEMGWRCIEDPVTGRLNANVSVCNIVAGDGYRAGNEECDDGNLLSDDGCSNLMKIEAGANCTVDLNGKSICKKCGNGRLEANEVCDDAGASRACMNCTSVKAGWSCSGTSCVAGPASVGEPVPTTAQENSLEVSWIAPDANGLPLLRYVVEWITSSSAWSGSLSAVVPPTQTSYAIGNLTSSTFYVVRVRSCNVEGCSAFSAASAPFSTLKKVVQLTEIGTKISVAVASAANSSGVSVNGSIGVALPPPPPPAPPQQEVNETLIQLNQALVQSSILQSQVALVPLPSQFAIGFSRDVQDLTVSELMGRLKFTLQLVRKSDGSTQHEGLDSTVSVRWQVVGADALMNITELKDVSPMSGAVIFLPGEVNKTVSIHLVNNTDLNYGKSDKQFVLKLAAPMGGSSIGSRNQVKITIIDDEEPPVLSVKSSRVSVFAGSIVQIAVERSGRTAGALIVKCRTVDGTAKASQDFLVETLLQARMDDGTNQASINISTLNAQRNQAVGFGFEIESVKSECVPGDGTFECDGRINSSSSKAVVMIERSAGICGDGIRGLGETCDDGNAASKDGCSQMCSVETGFSCDYKSGKDICTTPKANGTTPKASSCGNGIRDLEETCDDGNEFSDDGCSEMCSVEAGFSCTYTSVKDICTTPKTPPEGEVFIVATVMMVGVTADQFVGAKRRVFRQSIADISGVVLDKVVITSVKLLQNRRASELEVQFQVQASQNKAGAIADALVGAAKDGSLSAKLKERGLNADVSKMSPPQALSSDGTQMNLEQPWIIIPIIATIVPVAGVLCLCALFCAHRKRQASKFVVTPRNSVLSTTTTTSDVVFCQHTTRPDPAGTESVIVNEWYAGEPAYFPRKEMAAKGEETTPAAEARAPTNLIETPSSLYYESDEILTGFQNDAEDARVWGRLRV